VTKAVTIDDYIALAPEAGRSLLERLRALCHDAAPHAAEQIKWGHPAYVHPDGVILFMFSAHRAHASFAVTPTTRAAFAADLVRYRTGKGTVALPYDLPPPQAILRRMIEFRIREYENDGVNGCEGDPPTRLATARSRGRRKPRHQARASRRQRPGPGRGAAPVR
jgi:uncharacterized protein YdhG (YjbR/CyaY superfamily)